MKIANFDVDEKVFIIAEIGNNHEGDYSLAVEMIKKAAASGADAVKFQTIVPEKLVSKDQQQRIEQLKKFQFTQDQFTSLKKIADEHNIHFISTPFDLESAAFLNEIVPAFKIASGDNNFFPLIEKIAQYQKPIILSTGMTTMEEITKIRDFIAQIWEKNNYPLHNLAFLHCVVSYPTPPEQANLSVIAALSGLGTTIGYSDHTIGIDAALLSVAFGARIIEKHFTIDKNYSSFRDHQLSADPSELKMLVEKVRLCEKMLGTGQKELQQNEIPNQIPVRRSIVAAHDLKQGHVLAMEDFLWVRPGDGLAPGNEHKLIGKKLTCDIAAGAKINEAVIT